MKLDSIKYRLMLICFVCLLGMTLMILNQLYFTKRLADLDEQAHLLHTLNLDLLKMRQAEKDYLLGDYRNKIDEFRQQAQLFASGIRQLHLLTMAYALDKENLQALDNGFEQYQVTFYQTAELQETIGLDEALGYQGKFRHAVHQLEEEFLKQNRGDWLHLLLQVRRSEKDFMLRKRPEYQERAFKLLKQLRLDIIRVAPSQSVPLLSLLNNYRQGLSQLVVSYDQMGLSPIQGYRGKLHDGASLVERQLSKVGKQLTPVIKHEEYRVQRNGLIILIVTASLLLVMLIRSVVTFQQAFANFVMFFYRCKRNYQPIDKKKLGFSEFQSLAEVANEMINSRQQAEMQLDYANREVARLKMRQE